VRLLAPAEAANEDLDISIKPLQTGGLSGQPFEITASGKTSKADIRQFSKPLTIEAQYDPQSLHGPEDLANP
jgi:hypothetical protein